MPSDTLPPPVRTPPAVRRDEAIEPGRLRRALKLGIVKVGEHQYEVQGSKGWRPVDLTVDPPCYCEDVEYRGFLCKHALLARLVDGDLGLLQQAGAILLAQEKHNAKGA